MTGSDLQKRPPPFEPINSVHRPSIVQPLRKRRDGACKPRWCERKPRKVGSGSGGGGLDSLRASVAVDAFMLHRPGGAYMGWEGPRPACFQPAVEPPG